MAKMKKLVIIETRGPIPELGNINGPILNPTVLDTDIITKMVASHVKVVEVNPDNYNQKHTLTMQTILIDNFNKSVIPSKPTAKVESKPTVVSDFKK